MTATWKRNQYDLNECRKVEYSLDVNKSKYLVEEIQDGSLYYTFSYYRSRSEGGHECFLQTDNTDLIDLMCKHYNITNPLN